MKIYKKKILILISISFLFSQFDWDDNGSALRQGYHIEWQRTADVGASGEVIFAWSDTRDGGRDIYGKKIDQNGNNIWNADGQVIVKAEGRQEDPQLVSDNNGGAYIIWKDYRYEPDDGDFFAQHILSDGSLAWDIGGVPLTTVAGKQTSPNLCVDGQGGAFAIWRDESLGSGIPDLYGTHLGPDVLNPGVGVLLNSSNLSYGGVSLEVASSGSAMLVWSYTVGSNDEDLYAQRIDSSCNTLWSTPEEGGIPFYQGGGVQESPRVTYYNEEYSIVVWEDDRSGDDDIYAQFIDMNGSILFDSSGILVSSAIDRQYKPRVKANNLGAYIAWYDLRDNLGATPVNNDIYLQRVTIENGVEWENELAIARGGFFTDLSYIPDNTESRLTTDLNGNAYVTWMNDSNVEGEYDISLQLINSNSEIIFNENGLIISDVDKRQESPIVRSDGSGGAFVVWGDKRNGSIGIYAQHVYDDGSLSLLEDGAEFYWGIDGNAISSYASKPSALYVGNNELVVSWTDQRFGQNLKNFGQKIYSGWLNSNVSDGYILSNATAQDYPVLENLDNNIIHVFPDVSGEVKLKYQVLDQSLNLLNGESSSLVNPNSDSPQFYNSFSLVDTDNGTFLAFSEQVYFAAFNVFIQKFNDSGSVFSSPISLTSNFSADENVRKIHDIAGYGLIIIYDSESWLTGRKVKLMAVDYDGNVLQGWNDGIDISDVDSNQDYLQSVTTNNGVFIIWNDGRGDGDDIYGQMIDINGNLLGNSSGLEIAAYDSYQQNPSMSYNSQLNEVLVCWEDYIDNSYYDISCRYVLTPNTPPYLDAEPIYQIANTVSSNQISPFVYTTLDGSYLITWQDSRNYAGTVAPNDDIYIQLITYEDGPVYEQNGVAVCNADFSQNNPQIELYDETSNSYLVYWNDLRSSGKADLVNIYGQSITVSTDSLCMAGDVSGDGVINVIDVISTVNHIIGNFVLEGDSFCAADLNDDGIINVTDIISLINIILS
jgi:hypothetical protein